MKVLYCWVSRACSVLVHSVNLEGDGGERAQYFSRILGSLKKCGDLLSAPFVRCPRPPRTDSSHTLIATFFCSLLDKRLLTFQNPNGSYLSAFCSLRKKNWSATAFLLFWRVLASSPAPCTAALHQSPSMARLLGHRQG